MLAFKNSHAWKPTLKLLYCAWVDQWPHPVIFREAYIFFSLEIACMPTCHLHCFPMYLELFYTLLIHISNLPTIKHSNTNLHDFCTYHANPNHSKNTKRPLHFKYLPKRYTSDTIKILRPSSPTTLLSSQLKRVRMRSMERRRSFQANEGGGENDIYAFRLYFTHAQSHAHKLSSL